MSTTIATTILQQLGGNRFIAMTGAKNLVAEENALIFMLPENLTKNRITAVGIYLEPSDTRAFKVTGCSGKSEEFFCWSGVG